MKFDQKQIKYFQNIILGWFKENGRSFPWREKNLNTFQLIIAEALLQRTKAETVAKFYPKFVSQFGNWKSIKQTSIPKLQDALKPIGLFRQRAKRIHALSLEMDSLDDNLPKSEDKLLAIPMVGQYIANAILLLIHEFPKPLLDVNMARVLERFFGPRKLADIRHDRYLQEVAHVVVKHKKMREINWGILDFAAIICKKTKPNCKSCPLNKRCLFYKELSI